jgi:hypothetical protein
MDNIVYANYMPLFASGVNVGKSLFREEYKRLIKEYHEAHSACPSCGCTSHQSTYMGYVMYMSEPEKYKDENIVKCSSCGWGGITHDLVKEKT